ncbi:MAG: hypothetical protein CMH83_13695 [Nocardioides sp.]|nr:hypothetical protein [Nocardioides sp.]
MPRRCYDAAGQMKPQQCRITKRRKKAPTIVVWGDSHAWQMVPAIKRATRGKRVNLVLFFQGSCPPMYTPPRSRAWKDANACQQFGNKVLDLLHRKKKRGHDFRVVLGVAWELYHNAVAPEDELDEKYPGWVRPYIQLNAELSQGRTEKVFKRLGKWQIPTDVVAPMPMVYNDSPECDLGEFECDLPRRAILKDERTNLATARRMRSYLSRTRPLIRPATALCDRKVCHGRYDGVPTYWDQIHVGERTARRLSSYFDGTVRSAVRASRRG